MSFSVQSVVNRLSDMVANYSTGQVDTSMKIRAIDSAINYLKNALSFPLDEKKYQFLYSSDNFFYSAPSDFQEALGLFYDDTTKNFPQQGLRWEYRPYQELLVRTGQYPAVSNQWAHTTINGSDQLMLLGTNQFPGQTLETFDSVLWTAGGDASAASTDTNTFYQGTASEKFTLSYSTGTGTLTSPTVFWNFTQLVKLLGFINIWIYFPSTNVTNVQFLFQSSAGNSYSMTATTQANGTSWTINTWNKVTFQLSNATITGTPNLLNINKFVLSFTIPSNFGTVAGFRVDDLYIVYPDLMDLIYTSNLKGTDVNGNPISTLGALTDNIGYSNDFIEPIALYAALYAMPQLRADINFMQLYRSQFTDMMKLWGRRWPRKRIENNRARSRLAR